MAKNDEFEKRKAMDLLACCFRPGCGFIKDSDYCGNNYLWSAGAERTPIRIPIDGKYTMIESSSNSSILLCETCNRNYVEGMKNQLAQMLKAAPYEIGSMILEDVKKNIEVLSSFGKNNDCAKEVSVKANKMFGDLLRETSRDTGAVQR